MSNRHLVIPPVDVILSRLKVLFESLNDTYQSGRMVLESDIISSYHEAMELFYESFDKSIAGAINSIYPGAPADPTQYNNLMSAAQKDLEVIFAEISALDRLVASSFNSIIAEREQILNTSKHTANKLGDYLLYADPSLGGGYFFGDSFNTADRIETGSSLVDTDECTLDTDEGVILLPLDGTPDRPEIKSFIINKLSNGEKGSNYQIDVFGHDAIETIGDGNPDTWFEYEKVTVSESSVPLVLDLTIVLKEISVINHININPINFGTATAIEISTIDTSKDGIEYISIKDEVPLKDFVAEEEDNVFNLSSSSSKNAGQGFYSFLPRKVQYIHIVMKQHTPYSIQTNNGVRLRYAIGLRDINVLQRKFKPEGSIVSTQFTVNNDVKKVSLWASENPTERSELADITHFISHDDGGTWLPIQPQARVGFDIPEVINFNNISENSVDTDEEVNTFRHKISMKRDPKAFSGDAVIKEEKISSLDIVNIPSGGSFDITLTNKPIKETVRVLVPYLGSFSCPRPRLGSSVADESPPMDLDFIEFNVDVPASQTIQSGGTSRVEGTVRYKLPFKNIPYLEHKLRVFHNGAQIEYLPKNEDVFASPPTSHTSAIDAYSKVYFLNKKGTEIQFGHKDSTGTQRGFIPAAGSRIEVCLDGDNPPISISDRGYILNLTAPSDGQKEKVSVVALKNLDNSEAIAYNIEVPSGVTEFKPITIANTMIPEVVQMNSKAIKAMPTLGSSKDTGVEKSKKKYTQISSTTTGATKRQRDKYTYINKEYVDKIVGSVQKDMYLDKSDMDELQELEDLSTQYGTEFAEGYDGMYPPIFLEGTDNFNIKEYDRSTGELLDTGLQYTNKVEFKDGDSELRNPSTWEKDSTSYTFDPYTGTVYLGSAPGSNRRVVLEAQKLELVVIPSQFWEYDRNIVSGLIDTQKLVLHPSVVYTIKQKTSFTHTGETDHSIELLSGNDKSHSWFNKRIVKGTVTPSASLFPEGTKPVEVRFIDGKTELSNIIKVDKEVVTFTALGYDDLYTVTLGQLTSANPNNTLVGSPAFGAVRPELSSSSPVNIFEKDGELIPGSPLTLDGQWVVNVVAGDTIVTVRSSTTPGDHVVSYEYKNVDPLLDTQALYSVDYRTGNIYFAEPIEDDGEVSYEVSAYSAFYNLASVVPKQSIDRIEESERKVFFTPTFATDFIKQNTASKARPQFLKVLYEYYKTSTESLADLEPYFSPICKDIAFRAVTSDILEEL